MINENDKQAILNGAYGITRDGYKCKYIGTADNCYYSKLFVIYNTSGIIINSVKLTDDFAFHINETHINDVVGLWKDLPEPFNLEKALQGEPVMLRNGSKAYVKYVMPEDYLGLYPLNGYIHDVEDNGNPTPYQWAGNGYGFATGDQSAYDIVSMWKEPEPVSNTVTLTLPCPLKEPKDEMWFITNGNTVCKSNFRGDISPINFEQNTYFGSKEDAQAWLDAMRNSRR